MSDHDENEKEGENATIKLNSNAKDFPDEKMAQELMECALNHYVAHHKVVLRKLELAQKATLETIQEIGAIRERFQINSEIKEFQDIEDSRETWDENIEMFINVGVSEDGLEKIETILSAIPHAVKKNYDSLIQAESSDLSTLDFESYKKAREAIQTIQQEPDLMSGLGPAEYELKDKEKLGSGRAYKILTPFSAKEESH